MRINRTLTLAVLIGAIALARAGSFVVTVTPLQIAVVTSTLTAAAAMLWLFTRTRFGLSWRAYADDHLKWAVFTPDHEVTFRTVMKPYAEAVQKETDNAVVFDLFPNGALGRNPGQQAWPRSNYV